MTSQVDADALYDALAHERRRFTLGLLADCQGAVAIADLAESVYDVERRGSGTGAPLDEVRLSLYHRHLPKLNDAGLVDFDPDRSRVRYPNHPDVHELLDVDADLDGVCVD